MNKTWLITFTGISVLGAAIFCGATVFAEAQEEKQEVKKSEEKIKNDNKVAQEKNDSCNCEAKKPVMVREQPANVMESHVKTVPNSRKMTATVNVTNRSNAENILLMVVQVQAGKDVKLIKAVIKLIVIAGS